MKFNDLKKWQKLLMYMYMNVHVNDSFTVAKNGDDVIKYGIVKNKNALYSMISYLCENSYIYNPGDGYLLTIDSYYYCGDLHQQISSCYPWERDEDEYPAQPNISGNSTTKSTDDSMKAAFESMAQSFKSMAQAFNNNVGTAAEQNDAGLKSMLDDAYHLADINNSYITFIVSHIDTIMNAIKNGTKSPNEILETISEIYSDGINPLVKNNEALKIMLSPK